MNDYTVGEMRENLNNALLRDYLDLEYPEPIELKCPHCKLEYRDDNDSDNWFKCPRCKDFFVIK